MCQPADCVRFCRCDQIKNRTFQMIKHAEIRVTRAALGLSLPPPTFYWAPNGDTDAYMQPTFHLALPRRSTRAYPNNKRTMFVSALRSSGWESITFPDRLTVRPNRRLLVRKVKPTLNELFTPEELKQLGQPRIRERYQEMGLPTGAVCRKRKREVEEFLKTKRQRIICPPGACRVCRDEFDYGVLPPADL
jgi:hypothetical protein